jgi:hypothetical protein
MTNAIFDLSNMFFRSMFIVGGYGKKQYTFDSQRELDQLMRKVATDVTSVIRSINPSRVIFAFDSKSWRKNISIDENEGYKGHRKKSDTINWDGVYKIMADLAEILKANGFIVSKIDNAEADDLMALWMDELVNHQNQHVILVSADEDVRQLVKSVSPSSNKKAFSVVYNPFTMGKNSSKKLFAPVGFRDWLRDEDDMGDIFNRSIDVDKEDFERILNDKVQLEEIDGAEIALRKIFCGDDGDNIPAIFTWINDKDKEVRITPSKYEKIINYIGAKSWKDLVEKADPIYDQLVEMSGKRPSFKMDKQIDRQLKLVVLDPSIFPEEIVNNFKKHLAEDRSDTHINPQSWNMLSMLEGTKYVDAAKVRSSSGSESSIFGQIDRISNKQLF